MMLHTDRPWLAVLAEMPSRPTSVAVSKPSPNRNPSGYMCQERRTMPKTGRNTRAIRAAPGEQPVDVLLDQRAAALDGLERPPHPDEHDDVGGRDEEQEQHRHARADHRSQVLQRVETVPQRHRRGGDEQRQPHHHGGMAEREPQTDRQRPAPLVHQLAGDVVDGGDVVGVEGVAQAERVGERRRGEQRRVASEGHEGPHPGREIGADQQRIEAGDPRAGPGRGGSGALDHLCSRHGVTAWDEVPADGASSYRASMLQMRRAAQAAP